MDWSQLEIFNEFQIYRRVPFIPPPPVSEIFWFVWGSPFIRVPHLLDTREYGVYQIHVVYGNWEHQRWYIYLKLISCISRHHLMFEFPNTIQTYYLIFAKQALLSNVEPLRLPLAINTIGKKYLSICICIWIKVFVFGFVFE